MPHRVLLGRRSVFAAAVPAVVVLGAALRFGLSRWPADVAGGLAYTALLYLLVGILRPRWRPENVAAAAIAVSAAVELAQLTRVPAALVDWWSPMRLAVGQSFAVTDLLAYVAGGVVAALLDRRLGSGGRGPRRADG